jgi:hypothetical protein
MHAYWLLGVGCLLNIQEVKDNFGLQSTMHLFATCYKWVMYTYIIGLLSGCLNFFYYALVK